MFSPSSAVSSPSSNRVSGVRFLLSGRLARERVRKDTRNNNNAERERERESEREKVRECEGERERERETESAR